MKKVLALVLTLAMLVGSMAVGLSAAFEFTATENGDKFENVYSIPLESTAGRVTYFNVKGATSHNRNLRFDLWFENADGRIGNNFGCSTFPIVTTEKIGVMVNGTEYTIPFHFDVMQKYDVQLRTGGAPSGQTNVIINDETIGAVDGQLATGDIYCGAAGVLMDNIKLTDGLDTQADINFDGTYKNGDNYEGCDHVSALEFRRDLGKNYASGDGSQIQFEPSKWRTDKNNFRISFDVCFPAEGSTLRSWAGHGIYVSPTQIGVGEPDRGGTAVANNMKVGEWYYVEYVVENGNTSIYVNGSKIEGSFPNLGDSAWVTDDYVLIWVGANIDNVKFGNNEALTFENGVVGALAQCEYIGTKVNIFDKISTYPVEGEATLIKPRYNDAKNPNIPSNESNYKDFAAEYPSGTIKGEYLVDFDLAIYPDKEGTISTDKTQNGAWIELITNAFGDGDNSRIRIGNNFAGKNKDLVYYGEGNDMQPWAAGEFHNVAVMVANGSATIYIDKEEVYSVPVGMRYFDNFLYWYTQNCGVIIDNYRIYDVKTFEVKVDSFKCDNDLVVTIPDVKAENFCEANGQHICSWARTMDPKCYENGVNTYKCWNCDFTEAKAEVATLEHKFEHYDIKRVNDEGLVVTNCKTSAGCTERKYIQLPDADDYTGTIKLFHDFQDDFVRVTSDSIGFEKIEDGVAKYIESDLNYNQIGLGRDYSASELNAGTKVGFDFSVNGTFDTDASLGEYGHSFDLYFGKSTVGAATIKYNMDTQKFYISSTNRNFTEVETEDTYELVPGEVYNLEVAFQADMENMTAELAVYLNGEEILRMDEFEAYDYITYFVPEEGDSTPETTINCLLMHVYGVKVEIDNFVIGDYDFGWNRAYAGDVDGDYEITVNDALLMRKYLAKIIDMDELYASRADVNGDGYVDAIDQLRIRKALAD